MKNLMLLVVIAFAVPACGKKSTPPPANPTDMKKTEPGETPSGDNATDPAGGENPCGGTPDPCAPTPK